MSIAGPIGSRREVGNGELRESSRVLLSQLVHGAGTLNAIGVTACQSGQGANTVAVNLAIEAASAGQSVLLIDANLQRPALHATFGLQPNHGFADLLSSGAEIPELVQATNVPGLAVLAAGIQRATPPQDGETLQGVIREVKQAGFDLVVFDMPSSTSGLMTARLGCMLDGVILVVSAGTSYPDQLRRERDLLAQAGVRLLGVVLNRYRSDVPEWLRQLLGG